ncbi:MAG: hypothetical protein H6733_18040 [Alphaproteobacteria bacterium]|nr:hypothetical protein [Alphaproteobacteria bacterium]
MKIDTPLLALLLAACTTGTVTKDASTDTDTTVDSGSTDTTDAYACVSDDYWTGGDHESPLMHPGRDCVSCHQRRGGPALALGGTVFTAAHEPDDCNGVSGAVVEIVDATDAVFTYTTNRAGNFYATSRAGSGIVFPITANVTVGGKVSSMVTPQDSGDCNSCHTIEGTNLAPGRITAP